MPPFPIPVVSAFTERDGLGQHLPDGDHLSQRLLRCTANASFAALKPPFARTWAMIPRARPALLTEYRFDTGAKVEALKGKPLAGRATHRNGEVFDRTSTVWTHRALPLPVAANETRSVTFAFSIQRETPRSSNADGHSPLRFCASSSGTTMATDPPGRLRPRGRRRSLGLER